MTAPRTSDRNRPKVTPAGHALPRTVDHMHDTPTEQEVDAWTRLDDAVSELWTLHERPESEIVDRVLDVITNDRSEHQRARSD